MQIKYRKTKTSSINNIHNGNFKQCLTIVKHHSWALFIAIALGMIGGWLTYDVLAVSGWQTDAMIYLNINQDPVNEYQFTNEEASYAAVSILNDRSFLENLNDRLNTETSVMKLQKMIQYETSSNAPVLTVLVTDQSAEASEKTANILIKAACEKIPQTIETLQPSILEAADAESAVQITADLYPYLLKGALIGLSCIIILIYILVAVRGTFETAEEIIAAFRVPIVWEIKAKDPESINHFTASYLLARPRIEKLYFVSMLSESAANFMETVCDYFEQYKKQNNIPFNVEKQNSQRESIETNLQSEKKSTEVEKTASNDAIVGANYKSNAFGIVEEKNEDFKTDSFLIGWGEYPDQHTAKTARKYDDVLLIIRKNQTKRTKVQYVIRNLQTVGVNVTGVILLTK